ncbi:MAG: Rieske (2Fe-2S) protein [Planctomycetia bacterium]|nr:Rieske (2Fe-2S) protein [Planctomycetia bacterium]
MEKEKNDSQEKTTCACGSTSELPTGRRCFIAQAGAVALSAAAVSPAVLSAMTTVLTPVVSKKEGGGEKLYRVANVSDIPEDGAPLLIAISDDRIDGWVKQENISVGAIFVRRNEKNELQAFQAICPHAGCPIEYKNNRFECGCHSAFFTLNGEKIEEKGRPCPSPRAMDTLEVSLADDGGVMVKFLRFKEGIKEKIAEG